VKPGALRLAGLWAALSVRERATLAIAAVLVLGATLYLTLWAPGMAARHSLSAALPRLRAQLEDMRWQREQIVALRNKAGAISPKGDLAALLRASAAQAPFGPAIEQIEALPGGKARVRSGPLSFAAWLAWVDGLQRDLAVRIDSCQISALEQPGMVKIEASFASASPP
jgi:type II secretory pathway component PulM